MRRPAKTTVKPAFIRASEDARPIPDPAPVTSAIFLSAQSYLNTTIVMPHCCCVSYDSPSLYEIRVYLILAVALRRNSEFLVFL